jgi:hypothetical protein
MSLLADPRRCDHCQRIKGDEELIGWFRVRTEARLRGEGVEIIPYEASLPAGGLDACGVRCALQMASRYLIRMVRPAV